MMMKTELIIFPIYLLYYLFFYIIIKSGEETGWKGQMKWKHINERRAQAAHADRSGETAGRQMPTLPHPAH